MSNSARSRFEKTGIPVESVIVPDAHPEDGPLTPVAVVPDTVVPPVLDVPVEVPELRYEYQPTDENGLKLGGVQVIKYRTPDELAEKLRDQNIQLVRKLRQVTKEKYRAGLDETPLPTDAQPFENFIELQEKPLTPEEIFQLSQDLNDPSKVLEAQAKLFEAANGCTPEQFRKQFNDQQMTLLQLTAKSNYDHFERTRTDFYPCPENKQILTDWMSKKGLNPTIQSFELALSTLKEAGLLLEAPSVREVTVPVTVKEPIAVPVVEESRIAPPTPPQQRQPVRVPSGLHGVETSTSGPITSGISLTIADLEKMPANEYKNKLRDPAFAKLVNEVYSKSTAGNQ